MSAWPLKPGTHHLATVAEVSEDGHATITVKDQYGQILICVQGTTAEYMGGYMAANQLLKISRGS